MSSTQHTALSTKTRHRRWQGSYLVLSAYCLLLPLASGCIYRSLTIRTDPPGAMVYVNDQLKGPSPVTYDFTWYGWHRIMIRKAGYQRLDDRKMVHAPIYLWMPFDLVMELVPFRIRDQRTLAYTLTPQAEPATPIPPELFTKPKPVAPEPHAAPPAPSASVEINAEVGPVKPAAATSMPPPATERTDESR